MGDKDLDIDQFRNPHESSTEWRLRRQFLLTHRDKFTVDRLLCLASCYINVECYGNRYPDPVMRQLRELKADLPHDDRQKVGKNKLGDSKLSYYKRNEVKFVRSTEQSGSSTSVTEDRSTPTEVGGLPGSSGVTQNKSTESSSLMSTDPGSKPTWTAPADSENITSSRQPAPSSKPQTGLGFREELQRYKAGFQHQQADEQLEKFYTLSNHVRALYSKDKNVVEVLHMAADKCRILVSPRISMDIGGNCQCLIELDCIRVCVGNGASKKRAKHDAFQRAIELLWKPYLSVNKEDPNKPQLESSDKPFPISGSVELTSVEPGITQTAVTTKDEGLGVKTVRRSSKRGKRKASSPLADLSDFVIVEHLGVQNPVSVLHNSASINGQQLEIAFLDHGFKARCQVHMGIHIIADEMADSKADAKCIACVKGLQFLKTICWTVRKKEHENADEADVTRDQLLGGTENDQISDSNVGKKLLERMGWKGGGLGREGNEGIVEPIQAANVISRAGLGLHAEQGMSQQFLLRVKQMIQDYCVSDSEKDLVFSPLFSKEERAVIHKEAQKMHLKSQSYGQGSQRYLVLSRRRTISQLFSHILKSGGETNKYVLIPPSPR